MKTLINTLADEYGLTQQQIADYFGIHFSIVSRIRSGDRNLPAKAAQQGSLMLQAIQQLKRKKKKATPVSKQELQHRMQLIHEQILDCKIQMRQLQAGAKKLKQQQGACNKSAGLLTCLTELSEHSCNEKHKRWLAETSYNNHKAFKQCDPAQQWRIDLQLKTLAHQLVFYEDQLIVIKNQINNP